MNKHIILISGKKGSGKTTLSTALIERLQSAAKVSFANPLKDICKPVIDFLTNDNNFSSTKEQLRPIWQTVGEVGRSMNEDFWVEKARAVIHQAKEQVIIIDDVRYENEVKAFDNDSRYNTISLRLESDKESSDTHESETSLDNYPTWDLRLPARSDTNILSVITYLNQWNDWRDQLKPEVKSIRVSQEKQLNLFNVKYTKRGKTFQHTFTTQQEQDKWWNTLSPTIQKRCTFWREVGTILVPKE